MLIIDQFQVPKLLPMAECIAVMSDALRALARGEAVQPLRPLLRLPDQSGILGMMPGYLSSPNALGIKVITVFQKNHGTAFDSHQGVILLFEVEHGSVVAIVDASTVTAIRTAAVSGVATAALARADASDLCIMGSGVQAETHLEAMLLVRRIDRVRVWSRNPEKARAFARAASERHQIDVEPMPAARDAVVGADIICTVTSSREPVLEGAWIASGAHVNAVGSSVPSARELDSAAVQRARVFTDRRESALNEAGDLLIPLSEGRFHESHIVAELGDVLEGSHAGRESAEEITLFKSLGLAIEDVAAAHRIYSNALRDGIGTQIEIGGRRHAGA
jgi:alanine dehydrogenase